MITDVEKANIWVERAKGSSIDITVDYNDWMQAGFACASLGEAGREIFHGFSSLNPNYSVEECDRKFDNLLSSSLGRVSLGSLAALCQKHGIDTAMPKGPRRSHREESKALAIKQAEDYLKTLAEFRYNVLLERVEYRRVNADADVNVDTDVDWTPMDDRSYDTACTMLLNQGIKIQLAVVRSLINSRTFSYEYNPVTDYLDSLKPWDGKTDYIEQVFDFFVFETPESRAFCMVFLKKWFICMVALWERVVEDNQIMPVLLGPQHVGKTLFSRIVLPKALRNFSHTIYPGDRIDKDEIISLSENCLVNFEEFDLSSKQLTNIVKSMVSSYKSEKRRAFGHYAVNRKRLCSFIGSSNEEKYLLMLDGIRRFVSVKVVGSHNLREHPLPIDEAYAQAHWIVTHEDSDTYRPTREESMAISHFNEAFTKPAICDTLLRKYYRAPKDNEPGEYISMADILYTLNWKKDREVNETNVSTALKKMGIEKKHTMRGNRFLLVTLNQQTEADADKSEAIADFEARQQAKEAETKPEEQTIPF